MVRDCAQPILEYLALFRGCRVQYRTFFLLLCLCLGVVSDLFVRLAVVHVGVVGSLHRPRCVAFDRDVDI